MKFKNIKNNGKTFLYRLSCKYKDGSIKIHLITNDDIKPHTHPWDFRSIILFGGYDELSFHPDKPDFEGEWNKYKWLSKNVKEANVSHLVNLRNFLGFKIPCLTIGIYGNKKQLCSLCKELGYCKSNIRHQI